MTILECYSYVLNRLNSLSINTSNNIPKWNFVEAFNATQEQWVEDRIKLSETSIIRTDEIGRLLTNIELSDKFKQSNYFEFQLPEDYLHYKRSTSNKDCFLTNILVKEGDIPALLIDENWKPSLAWGETLCTIASNNLRVYVDNFDIDTVDLHYYRKPRLVNMVTGFTDVNAETTVNIDPEFQNSSLIEILNLTCRLLSLDNSDQFRFQGHSQLSQTHT